MHWALFGGEFPGDQIIPRLYILHVLLFPGILLALIGVHVALVWYQKHTQFPGPGRTESNVVGVRILPAFAAKGGAFFAVTFGVIALMGGLFQINPIWNFGPYNPAQVSAGSSPTSTWAGRTAWPDCCPPGRSTCSATTRSRPCSGSPLILAPDLRGR